jgi:hypothetical protein
MLAALELSEDVGRIAVLAEGFATPGESVAAVLATEPALGERTYLCAFDAADARTWLALDADGAPVRSRDRVREAASIAALCEVADETVAPVETGPRLASPAYLDALGLDALGNPTLAAALHGAVPVVEELAKDIEANYKIELT